MVRGPRLPPHAFQPRVLDEDTAVFLVRRTDEGPARIAEIRKLQLGRETVLARVAPLRCVAPSEDEDDEGDPGAQLDLLWPDDFVVDNATARLRLKDGEPPELMLELRVPVGGGAVERKLTGDCPALRNNQ